MTKLIALTHATEYLAKRNYIRHKIRTKRNETKGKKRAREKECNHSSQPYKN